MYCSSRDRIFARFGAATRRNIHLRGNRPHLITDDSRDRHSCALATFWVRGPADFTDILGNVAVSHSRFANAVGRFRDTGIVQPWPVARFHHYLD